MLWHFFKKQWLAFLNYFVRELWEKGLYPDGWKTYSSKIFLVVHFVVVLEFVFSHDEKKCKTRKSGQKTQTHQNICRQSISFCCFHCWYLYYRGIQHQIKVRYIQGVSKKRYFSGFLFYFSSRGQILLFHMCFGIRISSPFHLAIQRVSIQNLNCPKNACADMIFIPALRSEDWAGIKIMSAHVFLAFLGQLRFWMDTFWIARWNGLKILIPKHMWKSKIRPLELK